MTARQEAGREAMALLNSDSEGIGWTVADAIEAVGGAVLVQKFRWVESRVLSRLLMFAPMSEWMWLVISQVKQT